MTDRFARGSEWRKWDLHLHPPGTKLSNGYTDSEWVDFSRSLLNSDVSCFGITDYFSFDGFIRARNELAELDPDHGRLLLPNLELRLNENVNKAGDQVDLHLIFRPDVADADLQAFLATLETELTNDRGRTIKCSELSGDQYEHATVSRACVVKALTATFGPNWRDEDVLVAIPAGNNGIRPESGVKRKASLADELDKFASVIFGGSQNTDWFLGANRFEAEGQESAAKPVFACSDAHSMAQLHERLGKTVSRPGENREITWIKADLTFEGLQQTLIEPRERVRIATSVPDTKEPYKVIESIAFTGSSDFPPDPIPLNANLVSVIGSRSSGKSALLAYLSHAVDAKYTVEQQVGAGVATPQTAGPAAGLTWNDVEHIECQVTWRSGLETSGRVVYIPQNSLYKVSERPKEISAKLLPALFRSDHDFEVAHERMGVEIANANKQIADSTRRWFDLFDQLSGLDKEIRNLGDEAAIRATAAKIDDEIRVQREASTLTREELATYQGITERLAVIEASLTSFAREAAELDVVTVLSDSGEFETSTDVDVVVTRMPTTVRFPETLESQVGEMVAQTRADLAGKLREAVAAYRGSIERKRNELEREADEIRQTHSALIAKNQQNAGLEALIQRRAEQEAQLARIAECVSNSATLASELEDAVRTIVTSLAARTESINELVRVFHLKPRGLDEMTFGVEFAVPADRVAEVSAAYNRQENTRYFDRQRGDQIDLDAAVGDPDSFLRAVATGEQKLRVGGSRTAAVGSVLCVTPEVEFYAKLEGDRIGGFKPSSMTPGKQALFALTLIINESEDAWPLLLDQPEDDLDSRSIYGSIVPYLMRRKQSRQIIMVSHDANLVVGADSEQIIVANRHGDDRPNRDGRQFGYLTGSLEWSASDPGAAFVLETGGTREHACAILDGGAEAFRKRKQKYKI